MFQLRSLPVLKKAIAYYRHSAEDKQENSIPIQREHVQKFAAQHNIEIIHEEMDEGKSGLLGFEARPGFRRLFEEWIENPDASHFDYVLVYDESRWGRFQNTNQAASYQFRCEQKGKMVIFVATGFPKDDNKMLFSLSTSMKREMSAEYSRDLSKKVFDGCMKVSKQGYSAGGTACYGMVRILLDERKQPVGVLKKGQRKAIDNARVTFTPANDQTTEVVKEIFGAYVHRWENPERIAGGLNERKIPSPSGRQWRKDGVLRILSNETYIGTRIYNKTWHKLKQGHKQNPRSEWVIVPNAFPRIVEPEIFTRAQERLYFSMPSQWKRGIYTMEKVRRIILNKLEKYFIEKGIHPDEILRVLQDFPIVYSVTTKLRSLDSFWCFAIPSKLRQYKFVIGISVATDSHDTISRLFTIPTEDFGLGDYRTFLERENNFSHYALKEEELETKILELASEMGIAMIHPADEVVSAS